VKGYRTTTDECYGGFDGCGVGPWLFVELRGFYHSVCLTEIWLSAIYIICLSTYHHGLALRTKYVWWSVWKGSTGVHFVP
jgi:hypothetical protein